MFRWGPIGEQVFNRTYSRVKDDGTNETFDEVVERMVNGNFDLHQASNDDARARVKQLVREGKMVPAGRHWWVSGVPGRQFLFNCHRAGWTDQLADHVGFTFNELMKGGGVGANYSQEYMNRMHRVRRRINVVGAWNLNHPDARALRKLRANGRELALPTVDIRVEDTREGWVFAVETLCRLAQLEGPDIHLRVDVSDVRAAGTIIKGFGGTASGPEPLLRALMEIAAILNLAAGRRLNGLEAMEIDHAIATCVIAGNVRRSARMSMMHWQDSLIFEFINCKADRGKHWSTNISVEVDDEFWLELRLGMEHATAVFGAIIAGMVQNSEPGIFNSSLASVGERGDVRCTNPCGEIALEEWENCNLGHVNLANCVNDNEVYDTVWQMAGWLLRATLGDGCDYRQRQVVDRNRRIGV